MSSSRSSSGTGNISISGGGNTRALFSDQSHALPTVDLGPESFLSVAGTTVLTPNTLGLRTGSVLAGGNITVSIGPDGVLLVDSGLAQMSDQVLAET